MPSPSFESSTPNRRPASLRLEQERPRFPSAPDIESVLFHPERQEDVSRRLQAPFAYLPDRQRKEQRQADRAATALMRKAWVFDEPGIREVKEKLHYKELKDAREAVTPAKARIFLTDYFRLLAESCVLQKEIADELSRQGQDGHPIYAPNVEEALGREDRYQRLSDAMGLYRRTHGHEQTRFAYGSTLKVVMDGLVASLPDAWHPIALTPRRGEMVRRFSREMLECRADPDPEKKRRIMETYFNSQTDEAEQEFAKASALPEKILLERQGEHAEQASRLSSLSHKVIYGKLGEEPDLPGLDKYQRSSLDALDDLLWVDNDFEKVLDQKMLLDHDIYLRLHLGNLLIACFPTLERPSFDKLKPEDKKRCESLLDDLVRRFGRGAYVFGLSDTELERRLKLIEPRLAERLEPMEKKRPARANPFSA